MSWYTTAASPFFIDKVLVAAYSGSHLVLILNGKRYEYAVAGNPWATKIDDLKKKAKTPGAKAKASQELSVIIRNLEQYRVKPEGQ
jgi:hypothetical protein